VVGFSVGEPTEESEGSKGPPIVSDAVSETVLLVDDDPVILRLLEMNFGLEGYAVLLAPDAMTALALARTAQPDVIVSDVMMPTMSGLELMVALRTGEDTRSIPVLLLSAKAQTDDVQAGVAAGADDYVTKPFEPLDLVERVALLLARPRR
jgi:DNA-binding response OmpR family regulator